MGLEEKLSNAADDLAGKAKEAVGKVTGDRELQGEGVGEQVSAEVKKVGESIKDGASDAADSVKGFVEGLKPDKDERQQ